jgi:hypothetical protein
LLKMSVGFNEIYVSPISDQYVSHVPHMCHACET